MVGKFIDKLDNSQHPRRVIFVFLFIWLIVNLIQSAFTELANDEAYYWMYSRYLDWGYYDHPPMIALLVKPGYLLFKNELGVRLLTSLMGVSTIFFIYLLIKERINKLSVFLMILLSSVIILSHIGGFLAIPDLPVVFFSVLFFLFYKKYLQNDTWWLAILLGITGSAMLYSKYHGILVLAFTLFSNLKIFKRLTFWIIPTLIILALLPHLNWQIENHFPTFQYHLIARSSAYKFDHTFNYIYSQLLVAGPFAGILLFYHTIKFRDKKDLFLRSLKFNFYGFFIFFFLSSFKGHVEPHWTAIGYVPVIVLSYLSIAERNNAQKWLKVLLIPSLLVFLFIRVALVFEIIPKEMGVGKEFHNWDVWARQIKSEANGRKVVFANSFQRPSKYAFYTGGDFSFTLNSIYYRRNQFDLWRFEDSIQSKPVLLMVSNNPDDTLVTDRETYKIEHFDRFRSYYSIRIIPSSKAFTVHADSVISLSIKIVNIKHEDVHLVQSKGLVPPNLCIVMHDGHKFLPAQYLEEIDDVIPANDTITKMIKFDAPELEGKYSCYISIVNDALYPSFNSEPLKLIVRN
jgi:4-amino-4-deoxy-L-arabinose transferase-like glycosyltransferase